MFNKDETKLVKLLGSWKVICETKHYGDKGSLWFVFIVMIIEKQVINFPHNIIRIFDCPNHKLEPRL